MRTVMALGVVAVLSLVACGGEESGSEPTATSGPAPTTAATTTTTTAGDPAPIDLAGTSWNVTDYSPTPGTVTNVWLTEVTIAFDASTVSGSSGCNTFSAGWSVEGPYDPFEAGQRDSNDGQVLVLTDLAWTEVACADERIMEQEGEILDLLTRAGRWALIRDDLHLRDAEGIYLLEAEPVG